MNPKPLMPNRPYRLGWAMPGDAVRAVRVLVGVEEHDRHDLAEAEGHDRQVVAAQAERRRAEQDAEHGGHDRAPTSSIGQNGRSRPVKPDAAYA